MSRDNFKRRLIEIAAERCAWRNDWQPKFQKIRFDQTVTRVVLAIIIAAAIPGVPFFGGMYGTFVVGFRYIESNQLLDTSAEAAVAITRQSAWLLGIGLLFTFAIKSSLVKSRELAANAALPLNDTTVIRRAITQNGLGLATLLGCSAAAGFGFIAWSFGFSALEWLAVAAFAVIQFVCLIAVIIIAINCGPILIWALLGSAMLLMVFASMLIERRNLVNAVELSSWIWWICNFSPSSWVDNAFEAVLVHQRMSGLAWLIPVPIAAGLAGLAWRRDPGVVEYVASSRSQLPVFAPNSPFRDVSRFLLRSEEKGEMEAIESAAGRGARTLAIACIRRELDAIGQLSDLHQPIPLLASGRTNRTRVLADLAQPRIRRWQMPWITAIVAEIAALALLHLIPYYPPDGSTTKLVLVITLCVCITLLVAIMRRSGVDLDVGYQVYFQLPVSFEEWFTSRRAISTETIALITLPLGLLLGTLHWYWHRPPLGDNIVQVLTAVALVAALPTILTLLGLMFVTDYFEEHFGQFILALFCTPIVTMGPIGFIHEQLKDSASWQEMIAVSIYLACCLYVVYVFCRMIYYRGKVDIQMRH